jgi:hypothetical protein
MILVVFNPDPDFSPIPDPGSRGQKGTGSRIRIRNTAISCTITLSLYRSQADFFGFLRIFLLHILVLTAAWDGLSVD